MKDYHHVITKTLQYPNTTFGEYSYGDGAIDNVSCVDYFHGEDNPNWREQVEKNEQAATPVTARLEEVNYEFKTTRATHTWDDALCTTSRHSVSPFDPATAVWDQSIIEKAEADAWNNLTKSIRRTQSSYDGMVFLGEIGQTLSMLRSPLKALDDAVEKIALEGRRKQAAKYRRNATVHQRLKTANSKGKALSSLSKDPLLNGKTAAELLLQWNFGIMPIINDLKGMMRALEAAPLSGKTRVRGYGEAKIESQITDGGSVSGVIAVDRSRSITSRVQVSYTAGIGEEVTRPEAYQRLVDRGAFNFQSVPIALYELLPWSFLLDYVSNVGDVLASVFTSKRDVRWIVRSEIRTLKVIEFGYPKDSTSYSISSLGYASVTTTVRTFSRTLVPVDVVKLPPVYWELPKYTRQYLNMAALARLLVR